ncbi:hypothetical protein MMC07_000052 [Pseudocyphellaria aurata]|nr:hypothetical protein [Pseudocyphellaria aurata]
MSTARPKYALPKRTRISAVTTPCRPPPAALARAGVVRTYAGRLPKKPTRVRSTRQKVARQKVAQTLARSNPISMNDGQGAAAKMITIKAPSTRHSPSARHTTVLPTSDFKIHEDTKDEEVGIILSHSAGFLDISGDAPRIAANDEVRKEDIPPLEYDLAAVNPTINPRVDTMARPPLGDLDVADDHTAADRNDDDEDEEL